MREGDAKAVTAGAEEPQDAETFAVQQLKAMEQPKWNEGRLDDLNKRVDDGIGRLGEERKELRGEVKEGFAAAEKRFDKIDTRFAKVDEEFKAVRGEIKAGFDRLQWSLLGAAMMIIVAFVGGSHL